MSLETYIATHPVTTHLVAIVLGGPAFGVLVNMLAAKVFAGNTPVRKALGTWLSTTPALVQSVEAAEVPGLTPEEHTERILNAIDAAATSIQLAIDAANAPTNPATPAAMSAPAPKPMVKK